jgi:hypothetical protein
LPALGVARDACYLPSALRHPVSLLGVVITTVMAILFLVFLLLDC